MITAIHIPTDSQVEIQDIMREDDGTIVCYVRSEDIPGLQGWVDAARLDFYPDAERV